MNCKRLIPLLVLISFSAEAQTQNAVPNSRVDSVKMCNEFEGADAGAKLSRCIASLSSGGTADARGLSGPLTIGETITDAGKHVEILLGAGTYQATANPAFECSGGGSLTIRGLGKTRTRIIAAETAGDVISKTCNGWMVLEDFSVLGNATADAGVHINATVRVLNNYMLNRVLVDGFRKRTTGAALRITGANTGTFIDSEFNNSTIGVDCTTRSSGAGACNLNRFIGGQIVANARHVWIHNAGALDSPSGNIFLGVDFAGATNPASIYVQRGLNNNFLYSWFEFNTAGMALIQVGNAADPLDNPINTVIEGNNFTDGQPISYLVHIQRGKGTKIIFNRDSQTGTNLLARNEANAAETIVWANTNNAPPRGWPLSDASATADGWQMGQGTEMRKTVSGFGLSTPLTGIGSTALRLRSPQAGTPIVQWTGVLGNEVGRIDENGHHIGAGTPTLGSCGTSSTVNGNDHAMKIDVRGAAGVRSCTVKFFAPWQGNTPVCIAANETDESRRLRVTATNGQLTIQSTVSFANDSIAVLCNGRL